MSPAQAMITAMITPALLILASGSLIATALARLARVIDRVRKLREQAGRADAGELARHRRRAALVQRAVSLFFAAIVLFVACGFALALDRLSGERLTWLPISAAALGMALIVAGCAAMLGESRLASRQIEADIGPLEDAA